MARGAPLTVLDDLTPLNGPRIDVAARIGWTTRMARLMPPSGSPVTLERLADQIRTSPARLHRLETGKLRDGALVEAYESVLGHEPGSLRAPIDIMCRTFPYAARDKGGATRLTTVTAVSCATERVADETVIGGDWLLWARALAEPGAVGMPESLARELIGKLVSELSRAVGPAFPTRYEALALLRCSGYGHLVVEVARSVVADPPVQVLFDLMSAVGEAATRDAIDWCVELLDDPRDRVATAGALALENMAQISDDPAFWEVLVDPLTKRFNATTRGSTADEWLSHLLRLVPPAARAGAIVQLRRPLSPGAFNNWSRSRRNDHWTLCVSKARRVADQLGLSDQPMLSRLVFDVGLGPHETRAVTSSMLVRCHSQLAVAIGAEVAELAETHDDPVLRARAGRRLSGLVDGPLPERIERWLVTDDLRLRDHALRLAGAAGRRVDTTVLDTALSDGAQSVSAALYSAGMTRHPVLATVANANAGRWAPEITAGAGWWIRQGSRVTR